ncbi:hypothetical protein [Aquimarina sp. RZ0]|uniref:hypothetical protein n=1 Tax=Aquimarina sp. RZ0 TaxID=2607730 RepID=UPI0011F0FA5B|nr:hypothetical protein [Aquimarina sp. RZ0]KAA1245359.1 hypothetical protein F0000_12645 [Aquimarina sp. RZ0]
MPDIKNEDLLFLHHQIEKAETEQSKLENLLNEKSIELKKNRTSKFTFKLICSFLIITISALIIYSSYWTKKGIQYKTENKDLSRFKSEVHNLKEQLSRIEKDQIDLNDIKDLYLYRNLINRDTVYSVQVQSFTDQKISLFSEKYANARFYNDTSYYKMSLGIFETLTEAQEFRKILLRSGIIDKNIFVISYKDNKRLRIEEPF